MQMQVQERQLWPEEFQCSPLELLAVLVSRPPLGYRLTSIQLLLLMQAWLSLVLVLASDQQLVRERMGVLAEAEADMSSR